MRDTCIAALYCDRSIRGGIPNYARELQKGLRNFIDVDLGFFYKDIRVTIGKSEYPVTLENSSFPKFEAEGGTYFALKENQLLEAELHHGVDASLSWLVPKVSKSTITLHDVAEDGKIELTGGIDRPFLSKEELEYLKKADRIVLDSYDAKNRALKTGIPEDKMRVVYLGVDTSTFKPYDGNLTVLRTKLEKEIPELEKTKGKKIITNISSEEPRKNVPHVLKAFNLVKKSFSDVSLVRVGYQGVPQKPETISLIKKLDIEDDVIYINRISREQIARLHNISTAHILPTIREGFCLAFAESMASACPVVAYKTTTAPEVVGPGGILVDYNPSQGENIKGLANATFRLLTNKKLRNEKVKSGLEHVKKFTWEKCAENTFKVYKELL